MTEHTTDTAQLSPDGAALAVTVPLALRPRGGRKEVVTPEGSPAWAPRQPQVDSTLVKALARAFRWRKLIETGVYASCAEIASAEKINASYVSRVLRLTLLAPEVVEVILDERRSPAVTVGALQKGFPADWNAQRSILAHHSHDTACSSLIA